MRRMVDARLADGETDGWHYDDMPEDGRRMARVACGPGRRRPANVRRPGSPTAGADEQTALILARAGPGARRVARPARRARVEPVDPVCLHGVLCAPVGLERDRVPRAGLPARLREPRRRRPRAPRGRRRPTRMPTRWPQPDGHDGPAAVAMRVRHATHPPGSSPTDGPTRSTPRLDEDMRRFADTDEVDLVIVGCGAGGATWPSAWPGPGGGSSLSRPGRSGTRTPTGSVTRPARTGCTGPSRG